MPTTLLRSLCLFVLMLAGTARAETVHVAVAASLQYVFSALAEDFQQRGGTLAVASFGASGSLATQIRNGAPFGVFLSADSSKPQALADSGLAAEAPRVYAYGALVLWSAADVDLHDWRAALQNPMVRHIAIANPRLAPYGQAALQLLAHDGLANTLAARLVYGESIQQVNQFVRSGAAQLGFTAKSIVLSSQVRNDGHWVELPHDHYAPIAQSALLVKGASPAATQFYHYLFSPPARAIWQRYGYSLPDLRR